MKLPKLNWFQLGIYIYKTKQKHNKTKKREKNENDCNELRFAT